MVYIRPILFALFSVLVMWPDFAVAGSLIGSTYAEIPRELKGSSGNGSGGKPGGAGG